MQLALKASQLLEQTKLSELRTSIARSLSELEMFTEEGERLSTRRRKMAINERMEDLVCAPLAVEDALVACFDHSDLQLQVLFSLYSNTLICSNSFDFQIYREVEDSNTHQIYYGSATHTAGPLHGIALHERCKPLDDIGMKYSAARKNETTYCHNFPLAFEIALKKSWKSSVSHLAEANQHNQQYAQVTELMFADSTGSWGTPLVPVERSPSINDISIVAWNMKLSTPEFPGGREIIVVANDVTLKAGSFGPREDAFFDAATNLACERKIPLIYLSATAGARIGVAEEIKSCFRVGWSDDQRVLNVVFTTLTSLKKTIHVNSSVIAHELKLDSGETRWVVETIVGKEDGLGCENLHGSGAVASAFSKAYRETFTLKFVTGRAVGTGAYLH